MIYTLTLSPAIDIYMELNQLQVGKLNRATKQNYQIGGKGINVSLALKSLGISSIPIVVLGGFTGDYIEDVLKKEFHPVIFYTASPSRMNLKILSQEETEINGITIIEESCVEAIQTFLEKLKEEDFLIVSGSAELKVYQRILKGVSCKLILDVHGDLLFNLLDVKPWLVKPNTEELLHIGRNEEEAYGRLKDSVSMIFHTDGESGARLITHNNLFTSPGIIVPVKSTIGCGDASLAGFLFAYVRSNELQECLDFANFCGAYRAKTGCFYGLNDEVKRFHIDKLHFREYNFFEESDRDE